MRTVVLDVVKFPSSSPLISSDNKNVSDPLEKVFNTVDVVLK